MRAVLTGDALSRSDFVLGALFLVLSALVVELCLVTVFRHDSLLSRMSFGALVCGLAWSGIPVVWGSLLLVGLLEQDPRGEPTPWQDVLAWVVIAAIVAGAAFGLVGVASWLVKSALSLVRLHFCNGPLLTP